MAKCVFCKNMFSYFRKECKNCAWTQSLEEMLSYVIVMQNMLDLLIQHIFCKILTVNINIFFHFSKYKNKTCFQLVVPMNKQAIDVFYIKKKENKNIFQMFVSFCVFPNLRLFFSFKSANCDTFKRSLLTTSLVMQEIMMFLSMVATSRTTTKYHNI